MGNEIAALEKEKNEISVKMNEADIHYEEIQRIANRIAEINTMLEIKEMRWLELSEFNQ